MFEYIIIVTILFFVSVAGYYIYRTYSGPRKLEEIEKLLNSGRIQEAISELIKLLEKEERNLHARFLLALAYQKSNRHGEAILELRQCLKTARFSPEISEVHIHNALASSLLAVKNYNEAKNEYLILTQLDPKNDDNYYQLGMLFFQSGVFDKATGFLGKAVSLNSNHSGALAALGQTQYHTANYKDARTSLVRAVDLKPDNYQGHYYLGLCLRHLSDGEWALREFEKAERDEALRVKCIIGKGMVLIDQESYPRAITELDRGLKYVARGSDSEVNMRYLLALAAEKIRDMHTAIENWEAIEDMKPGFRDVRARLNQYSEFRMDDSIKDFMIAGAVQFENICRRMLERMNLKIVSINVDNDSRVRILAADEEPDKRVYRRQQVYVTIIRDNTSSLTENNVREFHEQMKSQGAQKGIIMTTGEISPAAGTYASSRPIQLFDTSRLAVEIRKAMEDLD